jgi:RIO kinase 1
MAGLVHSDLSAYNLLWWEGRLVVIDLPQAVEFTTNADAFDLLHRDVANVGDWFTRRGIAVDVEAVYAELLPMGLARVGAYQSITTGSQPSTSG